MANKKVSTMNIKSMFASIKKVTLKELRSLFYNPAAYISLVVFVVILEFLFFSTIIRQKAVVTEPLFDHIPWLFLFLIPAITMASISQEKKEGTIEFYLTQPISELHFLIGKFIANYLFMLIALVLTLPSVVILSYQGSLDWGQIVGQYLAASFLALGLTGLGIYMSSIVKSQVAAFLLSALASFLFMILGFGLVTDTVPLGLALVFERISTQSHFASLSRGVLDLRDVLYFVGFAVLFLTLSYLPLIKYKYSKKAKVHNTLRIAVALFIIIEISVIAVGERIPGRIDLTQKNLYSLSETTKNILKDSDDVINITVYVSDKLPSEVEPVFRDIKDTLRDYKIIGSDKVSLEYKNPDQDEEVENEAVALGISPFQFNTRTNEELSSRKGYLGISLEYLDQQEALPFVQDTSNLEYELTSLISKLTTDEKLKVVLLNGGVAHTEDYSTFQAELRKLYEVVPVSLLNEGEVIPEDAASVIIPGPNEEFSQEAKDMITKYIDNGGSVFALLDGVTIDQSTLQTTPNEFSLSDIFDKYGLNVNQDLIYDLRANEMVTVGGSGGQNILINYPFWLKSEAVADSTVTQGLGVFNFSWASSISENEENIKEEDQVTDLIRTSEFAGQQIDGLYNIAPEAELSNSNEDLAVRVVGKSLIKAIDEDKSARIILVGDSDMLSDTLIQSNPNNFAFGLNSVEWLSQSASLSEIRSKNRDFDPLLLEGNDGAFLKYGNILGIAIFIGIFGGYVMFKKNKISKLKYEEEN